MTIRGIRSVGLGRTVPGLILAACLVIAGRAHANASPASSNAVLFEQAVAALDGDAPERAVDLLELLADRGFEHPDASYNRAVAYARRAAGPRRRAGDLGRAAAALEETLALRPSDGTAAAALERIRAEITRRSVRAGEQVHAASPSPGRALAGLLSENAWAILTLIGSSAMALGLGLWWWTRRATWRLTGSVSAITGFALLVLAGMGTLASRHYRLTTSKAVVIAAGARLLDGQGAPIVRRGRNSLDKLPEGALVFVTEEQGNLLAVEWGSVHGFVIATQLRRLPR